MDEALLLRALLVVIGYLAGSIPVGVLVARASGGPDPRTIGSGRTGGTNALRALGRKWAAVVVAGDLAKGALPVLLARIVTGGDSLAEVLVAAAAVAGSVRSIFLNFSGGRGVGHRRRDDARDPAAGRDPRGAGVLPRDPRDALRLARARCSARRRCSRRRC